MQLTIDVNVPNDTANPNVDVPNFIANPNVNANATGATGAD